MPKKIRRKQAKLNKNSDKKLRIILVKFPLLGDRAFAKGKAEEFLIFFGRQQHGEDKLGDAPSGVPSRIKFFQEILAVDPS